MPRPNGPIVNQSTKSETRPIAVLVGLSVPVRPSLTDNVLPQTNPLIPEFLWKIFLPAADHADTDAVEDTLFRPGNIGSQQELLPETEMEITNGVSHTLSPLADYLAHPKKKLPQLALNNATLTIPDNHTHKTFTSASLPTLLPPTLQPSKPKS
jgi:hypothetical protein